MSDQIQIASTTDDLSKVRQAAGLSPELTEQEKQEQAEMERERVENASHSPAQKMQKRIDKLTALRYEAERERDSWRAKAEQLERERASTNGHSAPSPRFAAGRDFPPPQPAEPPEHPENEPQPEVPVEQPNESPETADLRHRLQTHGGRLRELLGKRSDAQDLVNRANGMSVRPEIGVAMQHAILHSPNSAEIAVHLIDHPELVARLDHLPPTQAHAEVLRLAGKLENMNQPRPVSRAPAPISPLRGGARTEQQDPNEMDFQQFKAWRERTKRPYGMTR